MNRETYCDKTMGSQWCSPSWRDVRPINTTLPAQIRWLPPAPSRVSRAFARDSSTETVDTDGDGVGDNYNAFPLDPNVQKIGSRLPMWLLKAAKDKQKKQKTD